MAKEPVQSPNILKFAEKEWQSGFFLEQGVQFLPRISRWIDCAGGAALGRPEIIAVIGLFFVAHRFGNGLPALLIGVGVVKETATADVQVAPAGRAFVPEIDFWFINRAVAEKTVHGAPRRMLHCEF